MENILLYLRKKVEVEPLDYRILKLDQWNLTFTNNQNDVTVASFPLKYRRAIEMASLVVYKVDWEDPTSNLVVLKFRYPYQDLDNYLELLKRFPIFEEYNNNTEYDWIRNYT